MASPDKADLMGNRYGHLPFRRRVITISSISTGLVLSAAESGAIFYVPEQSTFMFRLPKISSKNLGINYEFVLEPSSESTGVTDAVTIACLDATDSSADIQGVFTSASTLTSGKSISPQSSVGQLWGKLTAVTSIHWQLQASQQGEAGLGVGTLDVGPGWTTGTT